MYFTVTMILITELYLIKIISLSLNKNIGNSLEAYYQDNYVPIICFFWGNAVSLLSRKLTMLEDKYNFLFLYTVLKSYNGIVNYL